MPYFWISKDEPECVIVVAGNNIFDPFSLGDFFSHLSQGVDVSGIDCLEVSAEIGLFNVVGLPVFGLFGVVLFQVFVVHLVNWNFLFGTQLVVFWNNKSITCDDALETLAWARDVLFVQQENAETLWEADIETCEKVYFNQSFHLFRVQSHSQVSSCHIQLPWEKVQLPTEPCKQFMHIIFASKFEIVCCPQELEMVFKRHFSNVSSVCVKFQSIWQHYFQTFWSEIGFIQAVSFHDIKKENGTEFLKSYFELV